METDAGTLSMFMNTIPNTLYDTGMDKICLTDLDWIIYISELCKGWD